MFVIQQIKPSNLNGILYWMLLDICGYLLKTSKDRGCNDSLLNWDPFSVKKSGLGPSIALKTELHYPQSREVRNPVTHGCNTQSLSCWRPVPRARELKLHRPANMSRAQAVIPIPRLKFQKKIWMHWDTKYICLIAISHANGHTRTHFSCPRSSKNDLILKCHIRGS